MPANTVLADINEIYVGYVLAGKKWYDNDAKKQFNLRMKQVSGDLGADAINKAEVMAKEFVKWAKQNGFKTPIRGVWWTARPNSMSRAVGYEVDQKKNPTDVLVKFTSGPAGGFLGLSAKATMGKSDIGFKNPGIGTIDKNLNMNLKSEYNKEVEKTVKMYGLPVSANERKAYIRKRPGVKEHTEKIGVKFLAASRDKLIIRLQKFKQKDLLRYLLSDWMDAEMTMPPYIKVTGHGNKAPYTASVMDPLKNDKLDALSKKKITLEKVGNESIGVRAGTKKIMKIRFKFESEKMASSVKLSGEPW